MNAKLVMRLSAIAVAGAVLAGCATEQGNNQVVGAAGGGAAGAALGAAIGGNGQSAAIGALAGMLAGGTLGTYWDGLKQRLFGSGSNAQGSAAPQADNSFKVTLHGDSTFAPNSARLNPGIYPTLDKIASEMKANPELLASIRGFTDATGGSKRNEKLSAERAQAVVDYLTEQKVPSAQIAKVEGFGSTDPVADNASAEGRAQNRRVEIYLRPSSRAAACNGSGCPSVSQ